MMRLSFEVFCTDGIKKFPRQNIASRRKKINPYSNLNFQRRISVVLKAYEYEQILLADPAEGNICEWT